MTQHLDRIELDAVRPIGARLRFERREWLPSLFRRIGHSLDCSAADIANWCGLDSIAVPARQRIGNTLSPEASRGIQAGLGIDAETLSTTVMMHLPEDIAAFRANGSFSQSKNWTRGAGTRYCPDCLREKPGVFYIEWRLWWCFICERHNAVLRDSCPICHQPIVEASSRENECRDPSVCWAADLDGEFCRHPLSRTWADEPVSAESFMLLAQRTISRAWNGTSTGPPEISPSTFRGTAIALLAAGHEETIARLAGVPEVELRGLFDHSVRIGTTPPREPLAMAALLGAAYRLITDPEAAALPIIRELTYERSARNDHEAPTPWSARNFLEAWPGIDPFMRGRVIRALDRDLAPIQRLVHGSAASADTFEKFEIIRQAAWDQPGRYPQALEALLNAADSPTSNNWADRAVPKLLWPTWAAPLGVNDRTDAYALQSALSEALRIAGTSALPDYDTIAGIGRRLRKSMFGSADETTSILRQLCELALVLRAQPGPINYQRRRYLSTDGLLPEKHWRMIAASVREEAGRSRKHLNARRYCYLRITATSPPELPRSLEFRVHVPDAAEYTEFITMMSAEAKVAIDAYLTEWLTRFEEADAVGRAQVVWSPPRFRHADAQLGRELDDIDTDRLHGLLQAGVNSFKTLAKELKRSPRHVRWAVDAHPLSSGMAEVPIDWSSVPMGTGRTHRLEADELSQG